MSPGLAALTGREILRVLKLWTQTVGAPVISSFLFIVVFGLSLGDRIRSIGGVEYEVFIVPGLITMAMVQAAYANNSASVFQAKFDRYLNDILAAPMRAWEVNLGLSLGGVVRAVLIGTALLLLSLVVVDVPVREPAILVLALGLALVLFSALGVVVGIYAESWDHTAFVNNLVILPLTFLGGVFYSVDVLPRRGRRSRTPTRSSTSCSRSATASWDERRVGLAGARGDRRARRGLRRLVDLAVRHGQEDQALVRVPAVAFVLGAIVSIQFGAALAATLFDELDASAVSLMRLGFAASCSLAVWRPAVRVRARGPAPGAGLRPVPRGHELHVLRGDRAHRPGHRGDARVPRPARRRGVAARAAGLDSRVGRARRRRRPAARQPGRGRRRRTRSASCSRCWPQAFWAPTSCSRRARASASTAARARAGHGRRGLVPLGPGLASGADELCRTEVLLIGFGVALLSSVVPTRWRPRTLRECPRTSSG
jgi:ABC-2 type transport system permease protein